MRVPFRLVDVFTDRPLAGNQLCVIPDPVAATSERMQAIACEIGFSETTFVREASGDRYSMRIFTPGAEMPFAGHPTLGTAFVLVLEGRVTSPATQRVQAGEFSVEVDVEAKFARMRQHAPEFGPPVEDVGSVAGAVGLDPTRIRSDLPAQVVSTGLAHLIVPVRDSRSVSTAVPHPRLLDTLLGSAGADGFYLFSVDGDRAKARMFAPDLGVMEDPATGSAAGPLGAYLCEHGATRPGRLTISQGEEIGRPSTLLVEVEEDAGSWRVFVGGGVAVVGWGEFEIPD